MIGLGTFAAVGHAYVIGASEKSVGVLVFVLMAATVSFFIGLGLLLSRDAARRWALYFSGYVALEKLMIFLGVLTLNGKAFPEVSGIPIDYVSLVYHLFLLYFLSRPQVVLFFKD